jgi:MFS family permease
MSEVALRGRRGFFSSFQYVTLIGGQLLAVLVVVILQQLLDEAELEAWGWRIPFVIGAITAVVALLLRRTLHESASAEARGKKEAGSIGRRNNMLMFGALGTLDTVPIMTALEQVHSPLAAFGLITLALAIISFYTSVSGIVKAEMFPTEVRALGVGLAHAIANALFGGTAEYVALGLKTIGHENVFYWYVTAMMAVAFLVALRLPRHGSYLHTDH